MGETVMLRDQTTGRLEWEPFGYTPFAEVPESPYYTPSPGSWRSTRAWLDDDGRHVVMAHDCATERRVHILRWPTWQVVGDDDVSPSYACDDCGLHALVKLSAVLAAPMIPTHIDPCSSPRSTARLMKAENNPDVGPRCGNCRLGLGVCEPRDPLCIAHHPDEAGDDRG